MPRHHIFRYIALATSFVVIVASLVPYGVVSPGTWNLGHLPAYTLLTGASILSLRTTEKSLLGVACVVVAISFFGLSIELLQPLVGRTTSAADFVQNEIGVGLGLAMCMVYLRMQRTKAGSVRIGARRTTRR